MNTNSENQPDLTTPEGVVALMRTSRTEREWNANCDLVKAANDRGYPAFWFEVMMLGGEMARITSAFETPDQRPSLTEDGDLPVIARPSSTPTYDDDLFDGR
jgi:hypothetical protein